MTKKVSSKIIRTGPFIERRIKFRNVSWSNNKYRRDGDIPSANIRLGHTADSATYIHPSVTAKVSGDCSAKGRILDCYA